MEDLKVHSRNFMPYEMGKGVFTPEDFMDEEDLISKTTEMFVKQEIAPQLESIEKHDYKVACQLFEKAGELGLLGIEVPESYGGLSLNKKLSGLVAEKMGYGGSFSVSFNIHVGVGTLPYIYFGTEEQKQKYLPKLAAGEWIGAYALTEPGAGSDALNARTSAIWKDEESAWVLNGEKQWITNAHVANVYVVFAKTKEGMTAFIVERSFDGVSIGLEEKKMGIKGSSTATLILEDVSVPKENVLGDVGKGHRIALNILNMARLKLAFSNIGSAKQSLELTTQYSKERKQFNRSLLDFTMIQEKIANMAVSIYGAESAAYRTAGFLDDAMEDRDENNDSNGKNSGYAMECAMNKVYSSEVLDNIVDEAVQIHGGYGYMEEYQVERLYRDARISRIFEGTNEINRLTISKILIKKFNSSQVTTMDTANEIHKDKNRQYIQLSKHLLTRSLKALTETCLKMEDEQEYMRLLADMVSDLYVMESSFLRTEKAIEKNGRDQEQMKVNVTDVLCEEGYRRVENAALSIISGGVSDDHDRERWIHEIRHLEVPLYENLFVKKRAIAKHITSRTRYMI
ncbi:acyl-CoA dehydrogenase family protein [Halobacillus shinanisalinarum]|uniref:acyl-CoA dehydrogenase family protein n=1 Tax=Halobacillus shinanisalinarum TaxID=2932258 RepID=UPI0037BF462C